MKSFLFVFLVFPVLLSCTGLKRHHEARLIEKVRKFDQLIVVHPTFYFDREGEAKEQINRVAEFFLRAEVPIISLVESDELISQIKLGTDSSQVNSSQPIASNYTRYFPAIKRTQLVESKNGENEIKIEGSKVVIIGGYLAACLRTAVKELIRTNRKPGHPFRIYMPLDAIYGKSIAKDLGPKSESDLKIRLQKILKQKFALSLYIDGKFRFKIDSTAPYEIEIYLRRPQKSLDNTLMAF